MGKTLMKQALCKTHGLCEAVRLFRDEMSFNWIDHGATGDQCAGQACVLAASGYLTFEVESE